MDIREIKALSVEERISIIREIWDSIDKNVIDIPESHKMEVRERIERFKSGKTKFFSWEEIKAELHKAQ